MTNFWLFCTVIDNYGDVGVSWRLARQLQQQLNAQVHLFIDDLSALQALCPSVQALPCQHQNIHLHSWQVKQFADCSSLVPPDVVIELFACDLPDAVLNLIHRHRIIWINWEYLSAEAWAINSHAMRSLQSNEAEKYFWQMGFVPESGGLIHETDYSLKQQAFDAKAQQDFRQRYRIPPKNGLEILVFGYESPVWAQWIETLTQLECPLTVWLAGDKVWKQLPQARFLTHIGEVHQQRNVRLVRLPFVPQADFDSLLWCGDVAMVRGEDSFVRAQLAGKPLLWHIYPQEEQAHLVKLNAFWQGVWNPPLNEWQQAHQALSQMLNDGADRAPDWSVPHWRMLLQNLPLWQRSAQQWQAHLLAQSNSVAKLAQFLKRLREAKNDDVANH